MSIIYGGEEIVRLHRTLVINPETGKLKAVLDSKEYSDFYERDYAIEESDKAFTKKGNLNGEISVEVPIEELTYEQAKDIDYIITQIPPKEGTAYQHPFTLDIGDPEDFLKYAKVFSKVAKAFEKKE